MRRRGDVCDHFVARSEDRARILARVDPDAIPPGVLTCLWLNDHASIAIAGREPLAPFLQPMLDTASSVDHDSWRLFWSGQASLLAVLAGDLHFAATIWERLAIDPVRRMLPLAEAFVSH